MATYSRTTSTEAGCLAVMGALASFILATIYSGWVDKAIWNWFAVHYVNAPHLGIGGALGLGAVISTFFLTFKRDTENLMALMWIGPTVCLIYAAVLHYVFHI